MPQHNPAGDAASAPHRESHAGEAHRARGQPTVSPTNHGEPPEAVSTPASIERAECPAPNPPALAQGGAAAHANQRQVRIESDRREQVDVDLLIQALLIIAEDMATPSDLDEAALT